MDAGHIGAAGIRRPAAAFLAATGMLAAVISCTHAWRSVLMLSSLHDGASHPRGPKCLLRHNHNPKLAHAHLH